MKTGESSNPGQMSPGGGSSRASPSQGAHTEAQPNTSQDPVAPVRIPISTSMENPNLNPYLGGGLGFQFPPQLQGAGMQNFPHLLNPNFFTNPMFDPYQNFPQRAQPYFYQRAQNFQPMATHLAPQFEEEDCIAYPGIEANNFELKTSMINLVQANQFGGSKLEDPKAHITHFDRICQTIKMNGVSMDAIKLRLFPFSLRDQALSWLNSFGPNHFNTWDQLYKSFMQEYYPPSKAAKLKKQIQNFQQFGSENLYEAWKRFKDLRRQCPRNLLSPGDFISSFYEGLLDNYKIVLDTSSMGGVFLDMTPDHGEQLIERITANTAYWYNERVEQPRKEKAVGMFEVDEKVAMQAQLDSIQHMLKEMVLNKKANAQSVISSSQMPPTPQAYSMVQPTTPSPPPSSTMAMVLSCAICGGAHASQSCQLLELGSHNSYSTVEQVDMIGYQRPQGQAQWRNQVNPSWSNQGFQGRNPPPGFQGNQGFRGGYQGNQQWRGNQGHGTSQANTQNQQGFSQSSQDPDMKTFMNMIMTQMSKLQTEVEGLRAQQQGGGAQASTQPSFNGKLPASTENPRNQVNAVVTRSGKSLTDPPFPDDNIALENEGKEKELLPQKRDPEGQVQTKEDTSRDPEGQVQTKEDTSQGKKGQVQTKEDTSQGKKNKGQTKEDTSQGKKNKGKTKEDTSQGKKNKGNQIDDSVIPCNLLPFPQRLWKSKETERENKFKMILDKLEISMPFVDAVTQIPSYKKFLKDILSNKKKLEKSAVIDLSEGALACAAIQKNLPPKLKDPGSFAIPCIVGGFVVGRALCDLGASVSLMPYSLCKRLNLGEPKPTTMTLQMADRSIKRPVGVLEDIPVMIDQYYIPGDFVILDIEEDAKVPIILGRPFLATAGAIIDVKRGKLVMEVADHKIEFDIFKMAKHQPTYIDECNMVEICEVNPSEVLKIDKEYSIVEELLEKFGIYTQKEMDTCEQGIFDQGEAGERIFAALDPLGEEHAPKVELKPLPPSLRYVFLGSNSTYPVIVNSSLHSDEIDKLLNVLRKHRRVIGYTIGDLIGIDPKYCMHRIYLEENAKPTVEPLRRLNPNLKDVVKKEILKLLEADIIYPISNSKWVSPIHVVPKKGGITVIENDNNELIPTRLVTGHRMCIDYRKLNKFTRKDHYPLPFIDQLLERMSKNEYFFFNRKAKRCVELVDFSTLVAARES
ncbi:uncharacterized protein LOC116005760 [Ipomoea triloba]|uniref:uncharacterized protein LOC116005760 n=1 Tax=Ipomoea triloba TaxID=35885 RepID=UPI00125DE21A|nr:uncharacterized protein LOC116005760 [Ipomoea triloba]